MTTRRRVLGLGIDGVPISLMERFQSEGVMPHCARLADEGTLRSFDSVMPTVSNVAWTAFQTGNNPGGFGIFGFVALDQDLNLCIPDSRDIRSLTIWEHLKRQGKRCIALSVPQTYPPLPIDGILVGGFLSPDLPRAVHPPSYLPVLQNLGYQIDIDPVVAHQSVEVFKRQLRAVFDGRRRTLFHMLEHEQWDLLFVHIMETDRINHFMWRFYAGESSEDRQFFLDFYHDLDTLIGEVAARLPADVTLMLMSDHGFCGIREEVQLNWWLRTEGFLALNGPPEQGFQAISPESHAVALVPGRIHLLTPTFWHDGCVSGGDYQIVRDELVARLRRLVHPETGETLCRNVFVKEEAFSGPHTAQTPDIIIDPADGYDFKASLTAKNLFSRSVLSGMHTRHSALLYVGGHGLDDRPASVYDAMPTVLDLMGIAPPAGIDGRSLLRP